MPSSIKYKAIADQLIADIQSNKLALGQRLPSLRQLTKQHGISMTTALNSYGRLQEMGWVVTQPKSGFFVSSPLTGDDLPTQPQFKSSAKRISPKQFQATEIHSVLSSGPLGISRLCPEHMPLLELKRSIKRMTQRGDAYLHSYPNPQGIGPLRHALADHFTEQGFGFSAEQLFISGGCMDAIRIAILATTQPGDSIAVSSPCFDGLLRLLSNSGRRVIEIPCCAQGVDLNQLEEKLNNQELAAILISSSHMNPHGLSLSVAQKQKLAELANHHRIPIIEDDVYGELSYDGNFPLPIKYWDTHGYVLWCGSVSKTLASGIRMGWCLAGRYLMECVAISNAESLGQNGLIQASLAEFIRCGLYRKHLHSIRKIMSTNARAYRQLLMNNLPKGSAVSAPTGGLVLWVQTPTLDHAKLAQLTHKAQLDIRFGAQFTSRKLYRNCFRINIGWDLNSEHDSQRTVHQALLDLSQCVQKSTTHNA